MKNVLFYKLKKLNDKWAVVFFNDETEEYKVIKDDPEELKRFLDENKESVLIGANNYVGDDILLTSLVKYGNLTGEVNDDDITELLPITLDITQGIVRNNLIDFHNMVSSLWDTNGNIFPYEHAIHEEDMVNQLVKDVNLIKLFSEHPERNGFLNWKLNVIKEFNLPKKAYHYSYGDIMREILGLRIPDTDRRRKRKISIDPKLESAINEKNDPFLNDLLEKLKEYYQSDITTEKFSVKIGDCVVKFNEQGILGSMESDYIDTSKHSGYSYLYIDFNSFGPNILINNNWLDKVAKHPLKYSEIKDRRIALKEQKNIEQLYYKYLLNSGLDYLNRVYTKGGVNVGLSLTITGVMTMMLLYKNLEAYKAELIECNTDGLIVKCPKKSVDNIIREVDSLAERLNLSCDVDAVNKIVHFDTKSYVMEFENGSQKHLGDFGLFQTHDYYCSGIYAVEEALREYYIHGVPVSVTLEELRNINDLRAFQIVKKQKKNEKTKHIKVDGEYYVYDRTSLRLFAVREEAIKNPLYVKNAKNKLEEYTVKRGKSVKDGYFHFELADQELPNIHDLDLTYYIAECYKVINKHPMKQVPEIIIPGSKKICFTDIDGTSIKEKSEALKRLVFHNAIDGMIPEEDIEIAYDLFTGIKGCYLVQFLSLCKQNKGYGTIDNLANFLKEKDLFPGKSARVYKQFVANFLEEDRKAAYELEAYEDAKPLFEYLKSEGFDIPSYTNWYKMVQEAKLEVHGFDKYIEKIYAIDDYYAKTSIKGWEDVLASHHVSPDDFTIMIGNGNNDLVPKRLNIPSIIVNHTGKENGAKVKENGIIIHDFSEIYKNPNFLPEIEMRRTRKK